MDVRLEKNYSYHICKIFILLVFNRECMEEYCLHLNVFMSFSNENCHGKTGNVGIFFQKS